MGKIDRDLLGDLLNRAAIYYLKFDDEIVYIGQTKSLMQRISAHHGDGKQFNAVEYETPSPDVDLDLRESRLILKHKPVYNKGLPIHPAKFGLVKEKKLPKNIDDGLKQRAFVIFINGANYYDGTILRCEE